MATKEMENGIYVLMMWLCFFDKNGISSKVGNFTYKCYRISKEYLIKRLLLCNDAQEVLNGISNKL